MKLLSIIAHCLLSGQSQKIVAAQVLQLKPTEIANTCSRDWLHLELTSCIMCFILDVK